VKTSQTARTADKAESQSDWVKTPVANLVRYKPSGIYFARVRIRGKLFRHSLKTDVMSVAKLRLADLVKDKQQEMGNDAAVRVRSFGMSLFRAPSRSVPPDTCGYRGARRLCWRPLRVGLLEESGENAIISQLPTLGR
jgi:hypothetical protein